MTKISELALETLKLEQQGRVVIARVDHPPFNYMTQAVQKDLDALSRAVDDDASVGAVVLTGAPEDRYITHFDIADILAAADGAGVAIPAQVMRGVMRGIEAARGLPRTTKLLEASPIGGLYNVTRFNEVVMRIMRSPAVWIAAINGPCGGGGIEMSVCFDVRIVADEGAPIILPELLIGLTTTVGAQRLTQLIGPARALEMLLEGRPYDAQESLAMGLVGHVRPRGEVLDFALELAHRYAKRNRDTVAAQKKIFNEYALFSPADSLRAEGAANAAGVVGGIAPDALRAWIAMQERNGGESAFLTDLDAWMRGDVVDLNPETSS